MIIRPVTECIILAGGLGTRLKSVVPDIPKCMAPVAGKPFLYHVINYLQEQGVERFIFSLGYKHEVISDFINTQYPKLDVHFSLEKEPLGTGGAIKLAIKKITGKDILIINGDTLFKADLKELSFFHLQDKAGCTLALKRMWNFERYGVVEINEKGLIQSFKEKQLYSEGLINGGVYVLNNASFLALNLPVKFSFEKDYLEKFYSVQKMKGLVQDKYFIDIGIPEDYMRADRELSNS